MHRRLRRLNILIGTLITLGLSPALLAQPEIQATNDGTGILAQGYSENDIASMTIRVVGPDGYVFEDRVEDSVIDWAPAGELADGMYNWETRMVTVERGAPVREDPRLYHAGDARADSLESAAPQIAGQETRKEIPLERFFDDQYKHVEKASGRFRVRNGFIEPPNIDEDELSHTRQAGLIGSIASAIGDFLFPAAHAGTCSNPCDVDSSGQSEININADTTSTTGGPWEVELEVDPFDGLFRIGPVDGTDEPFKLEFNAPEDAFYIRDNGNIGLGTSTPVANLHIAKTAPVINFEDTDGGQTWRLIATDNFMRFFDVTAMTVPFNVETGAPQDALYVADNGNIGIGTDTPGEDLEISGTGFPGIQLRHQSAPNAVSMITDIDGKLRLRNPENNTRVTVTPDGDVGIGDQSPDAKLDVNGDTTISGDLGVGTASPVSPIHVVRDDNTFEFLLLDQQNDSVVQDRQMMQLNNNGGIRFQFDNDALATSWRFQAATGNQDVFEIAKVGTGTIEMTVDASGNLTTAGTVNSASSRAVKNSIEPVNGSDVLRRLRNLPVAEWTYNRDPDGLRHLGPMAEDFYSAFGLGVDDKHISPSDLAGVALTAAKALIERNLEQQDLIDILGEQLGIQEEKIAELESQNQAIRSSLVELGELRAEVDQLKASWPSVRVALEN